jgi:hypothetical protein
MNGENLHAHRQMEAEGELSPAQWGPYAYVEVVAHEYRLPRSGGGAGCADRAHSHVAEARREAGPAHVGDTVEALAGRGIQGFSTLLKRAAVVP